jgi:hypothetical protein
MRNGLRIALLLLCCLPVLLTLGWLAIYRAAQHEPEFYRQALAADPAAQKRDSAKMLDNVRKLNNDLHHDQPWQAVFTADEVNAWLALDVPQNDPPLLPGEIRDPRVAIQPDGIMLAARLERGRLKSVVSLKVDVDLDPEKQSLALRIRRVRAGALPWSPSQVLEAITKLAERENLELRWAQADGDPVALLTIPPLKLERREILVRLDSVKLEPGQIVVTGTAKRKP